MPSQSVLGCDKIISHENQYIGVLTPKAARTTLLSVMTKDHVDSFKAEPFRMNTPEMFAAEEYQEYRKFAFVRDPWSRVVSCYVSKVADPHNERVQAILDRYPGLEAGMPFEEFVGWLGTSNGGDETADRHWASQYLFVGTGTPEVKVDFVGKYGTLQSDFDALCAYLDVPTIQLPVLNSHSLYVEGESQDLSSYWKSFYTAKTIEAVYDRYRIDVELFGFCEPVLNP